MYQRSRDKPDRIRWETPKKQAAAAAAITREHQTTSAFQRDQHIMFHDLTYHFILYWAKCGDQMTW
jgi:hypothetical protein